VDYCCNPQWNVRGGTVIPPHHLEYVLIVITVYPIFRLSSNLIN
jgi:hypothetical protein